MTEKELITVIIPCYNGEEYLGECLESVFRQSYPEVEIIVVNDGSTDRTGEILSRLASDHPRLRVLTTENGGPSVARNLGMEMAQGKYILYLDSDDKLSPELLTEMHSKMLEERSEICCCDFTENESGLGRKSESFNRPVTSGAEAALEILYQNTQLQPSPWGKLFLNNEVFRKWKFTPGLQYEDLEMIPKLVYEQRRVSFVGRKGLFYRPHPKSFIHTFSPRRFDSLKAVDSLESYFGDKSERVRRAVRDRKMSAAFNAFLLAARRAEYRDVADRCWEIIKEYRLESLKDPEVRMKNKLGILLSYMGRCVLSLFAENPGKN